MEELAEKLRFDWIDPARLRSVWGLIRLGLEKVRSVTSEAWLPEDVYTALQAGVSHLHMGMAGNRYQGFIVTTPQQTVDGKSLHIWVCYSVSEESLLDQGIVQIEEWARAMQANRITFYSPRRGWDKAGAKIGFAPVSTIYAKEVSP